MGYILSTIKLELDLLNPKNQFTYLKGKSIEEISTYANPICQDIVNDIEYLDIQTSFKTKITNLDYLNNNHIANIAYIALNSPEPYCIYAKLRFNEIMTLIDKL